MTKDTSLGTNPSAAQGAKKRGQEGFDRLLKVVGERVKAARARKKISRRILSEKSQVSQRYLAQLESGAGNISIGLLLRVASALDTKIELLVSEQDPWNTELAKARYLLNNATAAQREQVIAMLEPVVESASKSNRIALIGLRGAGKTTLGGLASDALNIPFVELNDEIEKTGGIPVREVFALYGNEGYRQLERQALEHTVSTNEKMVLAVAGGIVSNLDTFDYLLRHFHTIWIKAAPQDHMSRVISQGDERPMAGNPDAMAELQEILHNREQLYERADTSVDTANSSVYDSLGLVVNAIKENGFLDS